MEEVPLDTLTEPGKIVRMGIPPMRLEVLTSISGVEFGKCYDRRITDEIEGIKVDIIGIEELKMNKKASGRHKDLNDLEQLS